MPSANQIIPAYNVPHVATYINDNSTVSNIAPVAVVDPSIRMLYVFASPKGEDCTIKEITDTSVYLNTYGTPNMDLYGQAGYMPYLSLSTGSARCYCVRVMPPDAIYANTVVIATVAQNTGDVPGINVTYSTKTITDLKATDYETVMGAANALATGEGEHVVFVAVSKGRGVYGDAFGFRFATNVYADRENNYKNFVMDIIDNETGIAIDKSFNGTFVSNSIFNNRTMYFEDLVNDPSTGSGDIYFYINNEGLTSIYNAYTAAVTVNPVSFDEFDFIFGTAKGSISGSIEGYTVNYDADATTGLNFEATTGIRLNGGSDGSFAPATDEASKTDRVNAIMAEYEKAFYCKSDDEFIEAFKDETTRRYSGLISKRRVPVQVILDANYSANVKTALANFSRKRMDSKLYLDTGIVNSVTELITKDGANSGDITTNTYNYKTDYFIERLGQCYKTRDPFNNKVIQVTATYALATMIPNHYIDVGSHIPMVGETRATIPGVLPGSMRPNIDADDLDIKEKLYNLRINTIDTLSDNKYIIATQRTSQIALSDLSEGNNVAVLFEMKRMLENFVLSKIFDFAESEDRSRFTEDAENMFNSYRNTKLRDFTVRFDMNEFEAERNILHCYLEVIFKQISTRGIIEIDINKRTA